MSSFQPKNEQTAKQALSVQNLDISGDDHGMYTISGSSGPGPSLGAAGSYAVLAGSTVTNTGSSVVTGDLGVSPGSAVTGFPPGVVVNGSIHHADASAAQAKIDAAAAKVILNALPFTTDLTGIDLGTASPLTAGVYKFTTSAGLTGNLTLNFQNNPNALFVFQIGTTLTTASSSTVTMINGGSIANIFWSVGSSATLGTSSTMLGTILASVSITATTSTNVQGKLLAGSGAVTLDTNVVDSSGNAGGSLVVPINEPVAQVYLARVKVDSANAYTEYSKASISIVDSVSGNPGGDLRSIKIAGLGSLASGDALSLKYRAIK